MLVGPGLTVVDVSDVTDKKPPKVVGHLEQGAHTWTCLGRECKFAYGTWGREDPDNPEYVKQFAVIDLRNHAEPKLVASPVSEAAGGVETHDWNYDPAGVMWAAGVGGIAAYDVKNPLEPKPLNMSNREGKFMGSEYNDRTHLHGSLRPNARRFNDLREESPSVERVLLVSEEGDNNDCTDSFQTWYIPHLNAARFTNPGSIRPLDNWSLLNDTVPGKDRPVAPDFCSVHWFDYHQDGFVVMATYGAGTRVLDVRDAHCIRQIGYHFDQHDVAEQSYWVPERDKQGRVTGRATTLVYTADIGSSTVTGVGGKAVTGGIDIFQAKLPTTPPQPCPTAP